MGDSRLKGALNIIISILGILVITLYYKYKVYTSLSDIDKTMFDLMLSMLTFSLGFVARVGLNRLLAQKPSVDTHIHKFNDKPFALIINNTYGELLDVRVTFEVIEWVEPKCRAWRLLETETIALSGIAAALTKANPGKIYVPISNKIIAAASTMSADSVLAIRVTSVHSVTNFRSVTNAALFKDNFRSFVRKARGA